MKETIFKNSAKDFTLGTAIEMYELGVATVINDGKDITIIFEEVEK